MPRGRIELPSDALQAPALPLSYRGFYFGYFIVFSLQKQDVFRGQYPYTSKILVGTVLPFTVVSPKYLREISGGRCFSVLSEIII